jgi:predicted kinase
MKDKPTIILLRAVAGAGKSTLANILAENEGYVVVCADDYFTDASGNYNFDASKLGAAHQQCQELFMYWLNHTDAKCIIVANTNTKERDFSFYENAAKEHGAMFISLIVENRHGNTDVHNVGDLIRKRQEDNLKNSLKLI